MYDSLHKNLCSITTVDNKVQLYTHGFTLWPFLHMLLYVTTIIRNILQTPVLLGRVCDISSSGAAALRWSPHQESLLWLNDQMHSWPGVLLLMQHRAEDAHARLLWSIHSHCIVTPPPLTASFLLSLFAQLLLFWLPHVGLELFGRKAYLVEEEESLWSEGQDVFGWRKACREDRSSWCGECRPYLAPSVVFLLNSFHCSVSHPHSCAPPSSLHPQWENAPTAGRNWKHSINSTFKCIPT